MGNEFEPNWRTQNGTGPEDGRQAGNPGQGCPQNQGNWGGPGQTPPPPEYRGDGDGGAGKSSGMGTASMVLGIIGIVTFCCCFLGLVFSSLALILGLLTKTEQGWEPNAKVGVITGAVGLGISLLAMVGWWCLLMLDAAGSAFYGCALQAALFGGLV